MSSATTAVQPAPNHLPEGAVATAPTMIPARKSVPLSQRSFRPTVDFSPEPPSSYASVGQSPSAATALDRPLHAVEDYSQDRYIRSGWVYKRGKRKVSIELLYGQVLIVNNL